MSQPVNLAIRDFAQIRDVSVDLGDLTLLVGAQGSGKSLALQWLKIAMDGKQVVTALKEAGYAAKPETLIDLIFGTGMGSAWTDQSAVSFAGRKLALKNLGRQGNGKERAFFIPAHRSMLISDGWAAPFQKLSPDTPVVARIFSQNLFDRFSAHREGTLFPQERVLKKEYREQIDQAIFHGGSIAIEEDAHLARRLKMTHGKSQLPFMTWTAGQREFTPLLLGLYHLLPPRKRIKVPDIEWVIIEEPEMGLHPHAITVFLLLVLDLLWRGYRVVMSTHSPHLMTGVWMLQRLQELGASWKRVCEAFDVPATQALQKVAEAALEKTCKVHFLAFDEDGKVRAKDISPLDPDAEDPEEADWGGLTGFSSRFGDVVRKAVNEAGR